MMIIENLKADNVRDVARIEKEEIETPWGLNALMADIENKNAYYVCVKKDARVIGYGGIWLSIETADITNIAVSNDFKRMGVGTLIVGELIKKAHEKNCFEINLEVNENNEGAIALYEKCGFKKVGIRKKYYNNTDNAILMQFNKEKS